jgi:cyclin G-associated kinase
MIDTWSNYEINKAADIWALGCILYALCYKKHPFEDSAKLAITNANFSIPSTDLKFKNFHSLISTYRKSYENEFRIFEF